MGKDTGRFLGWAIVTLLLAAVVVAGCTRAKTGGPAEPTSAAQAATDTPGAVAATATPGASGEEALSATRTALAAGTATVISTEPEGETAVAPTSAVEPEATETVEPTEPAPEPTEAEETPEATQAVETSEATATPEPTEAPTAGQPTTHVVQPGENLFRIALDYGLSYERLANYNGITNPNMIYVGQTIRIPPDGEPSQPPSPPSEPTGGTYHVVQPGENLFRVALRYNMLYTALADANDLSYPYTVYVGQRLYIPPQ